MAEEAGASREAWPEGAGNAAAAEVLRMAEKASRVGEAAAAEALRMAKVAEAAEADLREGAEDAEAAEALRRAAKNGVEILAYACKTDLRTMSMSHRLPFDFHH